MSSQDRNQYHPDTVTSPGEFLVERLEELGISQTEFAARTGRSKKFINEIVKGIAPVTPDTALQFERVLSIPARLWISAEGRYREFLTRRAERARLESKTACLHNFPVKEMTQRGWLGPASKDPLTTLTRLLGFFGTA